MKTKKNKNWLAVILLAFFLLPFLSYIYLKYGETRSLINYLPMDDILTENKTSCITLNVKDKPLLIHFEQNKKIELFMHEIFKEVAKEDLYSVITITTNPQFPKPIQENWCSIQVDEAKYDSLARYVFHIVDTELKEGEIDSLKTDWITLATHRHFIRKHLPLTTDEEKDKVVFDLKKMILKQESSKIFQ